MCGPLGRGLLVPPHDLGIVGTTSSRHPLRHHLVACKGRELVLMREWGAYACTHGLRVSPMSKNFGPNQSETDVTVARRKSPKTGTLTHFRPDASNKTQNNSPIPASSN